MASGRHAIEVAIGPSTLVVVPSYHHRLPFAEAVNAICCEEDTRPDAVAVELGPEVAAAAITWMRELGIGPGRRARLPCMLALLVPQRWVRGDRRQRAVALQAETGLELHELPAADLERALGYRSRRLVLLSPTDSIVEALRCALELDVPCHGIDLDEHGALRASEGLLPDPARASGRVAEFARDHMPLARLDSDPGVNGRREQVMAARLRTLLASHRRVLLVCGMAHWRRLVRLLRDPAARPAPLAEADEGPMAEVQRAIVDPAIAAPALDRMPLVARLFERRRRHPRRAHGRLAAPLSLAAVHQAALRRAIRRFLARDTRAGGPAVVVAEVLAALRFPRTLSLYGRYSLREIPDMAAVLTCAQAFVSERFASALWVELLRFPWAQPGDFSDCVLVGPGHEAAPPDAGWPAGLEPPVDSPGARAPAPGATAAGYQFTWGAWDDLSTALCDEARGAGVEPARTAAPFRGSLEDGIALRATLRARVRGERRLHVWVRGGGKSSARESLTEGWPVVWRSAGSRPTPARRRSSRGATCERARNSAP
jgi:hypothetical protein